MIIRDFYSVIDISSLIWDEEDFNANKKEYYNIVCGVSSLFLKMTKEKPNILLRNELLEQMINGFPFDRLPPEYYYFGKTIYAFLGNIGSNFIPYPISSTKIDSVPDQIKAYFNEETKQEVNHLVAKMHIDSTTKSVYFSFSFFWNGAENLKTRLEDKFVEHQTILADNQEEIDDFFSKHTPTFSHNPKHDKTPYNTREKWEKSDNKDDFISRLSCYNNDNTKPQKLLDRRYPKLFGSCFYSFDEENDTYVVFRNTENKIFHGYDEYNYEKIPNEVKKHFNKWL